MTESVRAKAFEPFFTTKETGKGSGLGLAQVYGFVKQSGGGVRIETKLGEGTTVRVYLPRAEAKEAVRPISAAKAEAPLRGAPHVLLVDDDPGVRDVTAALLSDLGCRVMEASDGAAALDTLDRAGKSIDLVVLDYAMPGINGAELARQVSVRWPSLPLLFVTGYADLSALQDVSEERIVQKPFRAGDLEAKVRTALGERAADDNVVSLRPARKT